MKTIPKLHRAGWGAVLAGAVMLIAPPVMAVDGGFVGLDVGASVPTNSNYRAHAESGIMGSPYGGYMFNNYVGLQGQLQFDTQLPDNHPHHCSPPQCQPGSIPLPHENQWTTVGGLTVGPRLVLPFEENLELYATAQGGVFTGLSGRLNGTAPGFSTGAGLDFYVSDHVSVGVFGRWNRAYMAPRPTTLGQLIPEQEGPADAQWAVGGISTKYRFNGPEVAVPPAPPPPPPVAQAAPPPPMKKKIVLRGVNFDTNKSNIRKDAAQILDEAASTLKEDDAVGVMVVGHTDSRGSDAYNQKLSERRADSVKAYLVKKGVTASRLTTKGMGESQPVATNDTADGMAQNRRVELLVE